MKINVASSNPVKVEAVKEVLQDYDSFKNAEIVSVKTESGVSEQPKTRDETVKGAKNRAIEAFQDCDLSIGIEDGLMEFPETITGYVNIGVCIVYDGKKTGVGLSSGFEYPKEVTRLVFDEGLDINQAMNKVGLTEDERIGYKEGAVGILTKRRITRKDYLKVAIIKALVPFENEGLY